MSDANLSRLTEMAVRGKEYRETNTYEYFGEEMELAIGPLEDKVLIPVMGTLQANFGIEDIEEAQEEIEESRSEDGDIDPSKLDAEFVALMGRVGVEGVDTEEGDAEGADEAELERVFGIHADEEENIGLRGGMTVEIAQDVLGLSSDEEDAEKFRR